LWTLRIVLWAALLVIAFRGITAIISSSSPAPAGGTGPGTGGQFPVSLAEAYATEFGRVYLGFSPQNLVLSWACSRRARFCGLNKLPAFSRPMPAVIAPR
jgi:hypothetical protein